MQNQPDWNGLLAWSTKYHDGTKPSEFQPMSEDDKKWLEDAMKEYTFNDTDKLKTICDEMKTDIENGFTMEEGKDNHASNSTDFEEKLEEL